MQNLIKNNKKVINAWCMYDWANSVFALTITTAVFPPYFLACMGGEGQLTEVFGISMNSSVLYSYTLAVSFLVVAILNPILSGIADFGGKKKRFMQVFCYLGAFSCMGLYFFNSDTKELGVILFSLAIIGFAGSLVFYNSFLPEIATEDRFDKVSAKGFSLGYIGSVLLLILNLVMIQKPDLFFIDVDANGKALDGTLAPRISFLTVGIWWFLFAQITFRALPGNVYNREKQSGLLRKGFKELGKVWSEAKQIPSLKKFLVSFFFYSMGVQTVMYMATVFGEDVVKMDMGQLILLVLILQIVAIGGAYLFAWISTIKGNFFSIGITLVIWIGVCFAAYFVKEGQIVFFYVLGAFVGVVMGGVQSMSRSTYSKLIPASTKDHASYFSFFETLEKISIALGTFTFGLVKAITGNMNASAMALAIFFVIGIAVLSFISPIKSSEDKL